LKEVKQQLEAKIRKLERELKDELPKAIQKARELGDLRENAEYQAAKERQTYVQAELGNLKQRLAKLSLVNLDKIPHGKVSYGTIVVLHDVDRDQEVTYRLVTSEEADVAKGLISTSSPIGKSLMGKEEGDEVDIRTPGGRRSYEILKVTTIHEQPKSDE
jgi:transcription elongation factor GreA